MRYCEKPPEPLAPKSGFRGGHGVPIDDNPGGQTIRCYFQDKWMDWDEMLLLRVSREASIPTPRQLEANLVNAFKAPAREAANLKLAAQMAAKATQLDGKRKSAGEKEQKPTKTDDLYPNRVDALDAVDKLRNRKRRK